MGMIASIASDSPLLILRQLLLLYSYPPSVITPIAAPLINPVQSSSNSADGVCHTIELKS